MKNKNRLKLVHSNKEYKIAKYNSVLSHFRHGWCSGCQGPCDWRYFQQSSLNKRNLGKKPRHLKKPWAKK